MGSNNVEMKTGFWLNLDVYYSLYNERLDTDSIDPRAYADIFLHGICGIFALALHDKYGYDLAMVTDGEEIDDEVAYDPFVHLVHIFCTDTRDGELLFIDVRGITNSGELFLTDFKDFINEYEYEGIEELNVPVCRSFVRSCMSEEEYNGYYYAATQLMSKHSQYYLVEENGSDKDSL